MHVLRLETAERLRSKAHESAIGGASAAELKAAMSADAAATEVAWSSFVPFLAHPVTAAGARSAMGLIDEASGTSAA